MDSMDLWINIARDGLVETIKGVDCLILNDEELELLTEAPNFVSAAREVLNWRAPTSVIAKQGKYGAALFTRDGYFALPAYPLEDVVDPTGAGDSFAGGFVGYVAAHPGHADRPRPARAGDGLRHGARLVQRRGLRHRADARRCAPTRSPRASASSSG